MTILARFSVLALALVGFSASSMISHSDSSHAMRAGKLAPVVASVPMCGPNNEGGCNLR